MSPTDDNTNAARVILTAIAADRPGIVEDILGAIERAGATIETTSVASLDTAVSVTLLLHVPQNGTTPLRAALVGLTVERDIKFHIDPLPTP